MLMKARRWLYFAAAMILGVVANVAYAQGNGNGHGKGQEKEKHGDHDQKDRVYVYSYSQHDRDELRNWYDHNKGHLPPGLAKKDRLPPGWEKKMVVHQLIPVE